MYHVKCKTNLSSALVIRHVSFLLGKGHLQIHIGLKGTRHYLLTSRGQHLLSSLVEVEKELQGLFPETLPHRLMTQIQPMIRS
jgi:predicted transcriptional regulator